MAETGPFRRRPLPGRLRWTLAAVAVGLSILLGTAVALKPDPRGLGTHQRVGLPPCTFRVLFGRPCPTCGMTTSWAHLVRGEVIDALRANVAGALLCALAIVAVPWLAISAVRGRWIGWEPRATVIAWTASIVAAVTVVTWVIRLMSG